MKPLSNREAVTFDLSSDYGVDAIVVVCLGLCSV